MATINTAKYVIMKSCVAISAALSKHGILTKRQFSQDSKCCEVEPAQTDNSSAMKQLTERNHWLITMIWVPNWLNDATLGQELFYSELHNGFPWPSSSTQASDRHERNRVWAGVCKAHTTGLWISATLHYLAICRMNLGLMKLGRCLPEYRESGLQLCGGG